MKKLMFALLAVAAVATVNAAETKWRYSLSTGILSDGYNNNTAGKVVGANVYVIYDAITQDQLVKDFLDPNKTVNLASYAVTGSSASGGTETAVTVQTDSNGKNMTGKTFFNADDFVKGSAYKFYQAAIITYNDKEYLYVSELTPEIGAQDSTKTTPIAIPPNNDSKVFNKDATGFVKGGWYTASAVPEPTSGLLLLLGVAGLALKRKRA